MLFSNQESIMILKLLIALLLGALVGIEREFRHKPAGLRTHILVCMGSCLFVSVWIDMIGISMDSAARLAAGVATGLGFIGAGNIMAERTGTVHGLTTAATIWMVGAIGVCTALGGYALATIASIITVIVLLIGRIERWKIR